MTNPFEDLAERQIAKPVKRQQAATAKRKATMAAKKKDAPSLADYSRQVMADRDRVLVTNHHGVELTELLSALERIGVGDSKLLIAHVTDLSTDWIAKADAEARFWAVRFIAYRIAEIRKGAGLEPLDDPLPPYTNAFITCRAIVQDAGYADLYP